MGRKSQLAIEYAYKFCEDNPRSHIFWVYAANFALFEQAYRDMARRLKLCGPDDRKVDPCQLFSRWLDEEEEASWLLILDNADSADLFITRTASIVAETSTNTLEPLIRFLPKRLAAKNQLLVTTRSRIVGEELAGEAECIAVQPFSPEESKHLFKSKLKKRKVRLPDHDLSERLLEVLAFIPLAITQAAAFINQTTMSIQDYLAFFEKNNENFKDALSTELQDLRRQIGFPNSVFRTWKLSFDQILNQSPGRASSFRLWRCLIVATYRRDGFSHQPRGK